VANKGRVKLGFKNLIVAANLDGQKVIETPTPITDFSWLLQEGKLDVF
jgi:hypothetical protein